MVIIQIGTYTLIELVGKITIQAITDKAENQRFNQNEAILSQIAQLIKLNIEKRTED